MESDPLHFRGQATFVSWSRLAAQQLLFKHITGSYLAYQRNPIVPDYCGDINGNPQTDQLWQRL